MGISQGGVRLWVRGSADGCIDRSHEDLPRPGCKLQIDELEKVARGVPHDVRGVDVAVHQHAVDVLESQEHLHTPAATFSAAQRYILVALQPER